jgi:hypothetical protein
MHRRAAREKDDDATSQIQCYYLHDLSFHGPSAASKPYVSVSILDPITTVERHHGKYHIAARFNIETTILNYEGRTRQVPTPSSTIHFFISQLTTMIGMDTSISSKTSVSNS